MLRRAVVFDLEPDLWGLAQIGLAVSFEDKDEAKALGGYRWDAERKCWAFPASMRRAAQRVANRLNREHGFTVSDDDRAAAGEPTKHTSAPPPADLRAAIVTMLELIPPECRKSAVRGLARALHPDTGGDHRAMQALVAAKEVFRL